MTNPDQAYGSDDFDWADSRIDPDAQWQLVDWAAHTHHRSVRGRRVRYADIGSGPAVVLLHGQGASWRWWLRIIPAVAARSRVIAVDLAGFGGSDPIVTGDVFDEHVTTIVELLDQLGVSESIVVGHSMGGLVALRLACEHPRRVRGLLLSNAGGGTISPQRLRFIVGGLRVFHTVLAVPGVAHLIATRRRLRAAFSAAAVHDHRALSTILAVEIVPRVAPPGFVQTLRAAAKAVNEVTPQRVTCPCLVVWGTRDRILPLSAGRALALALPDSRFVPLEGVGHCPMIESPAQFSQLLADFAGDPSGGRPIGQDPALPIAPQPRRGKTTSSPRGAPSDFLVSDSTARPPRRRRF